MPNVYSGFWSPTCFNVPVVAVLVWAGPEWTGLRGGLQFYTHVLGLCSYSRSTVRIGARWDTRAALAYSSFSAQKTHSSDAAVRKRRAFNREFQSCAIFKRVGSRMAKSRFSESTSTHALLPAMWPIALERRAVHSRWLDLSGLRLLRRSSRRVLVGLRFKVS